MLSLVLLNKNVQFNLNFDSINDNDIKEIQFLEELALEINQILDIK